MGSEAGCRDSGGRGAGRRGLGKRCAARRPAERHGGLRGAARPTATESWGPPHPRRRLRGAETGRRVQSSASPAEKVSQVAGLKGLPPASCRYSFPPGLPTALPPGFHSWLSGSPTSSLVIPSRIFPQRPFHPGSHPGPLGSPLPLLSFYRVLLPWSHT